MIELYSKPRSNEIGLSKFLEIVKKQFPEVKFINESYDLAESLFKNNLNIREIELLVKNTNLIKEKKKDYVLKELATLPDKIKVAQSIKQISVDIVVKNGENLIYIEFHEIQHRSLSIKRKSPIFTWQNERIEVSRGVQRLLKDIWRYKYLPYFKIIWWDWVEIQRNREQLFISLFDQEAKEFCLENKFSFKGLLKY